MVSGYGRSDLENWGRIVVVHLKRTVAHDLEPMHDGFNTGERIQVCKGGCPLVLCDVEAVPVEEKDEGRGDDFGEERRVNDRLPHRCRGENGFPAEEEEEERWSALD